MNFGRKRYRTAKPLSDHSDRISRSATGPSTVWTIDVQEEGQEEEEEEEKEEEEERRRKNK